MELIKNNKYTFEVIGTDAFLDEKFYLISCNGSTIRVEKYPHQSDNKKSIECIYMGKNLHGKLMFKQDMTDVLYEIYEDGCEYDFTVTQKCFDLNSKSYYLLLLDDYNFKHRLYTSQSNLYEKGDKITCTVKKITNGHLILDFTDDNEDNKYNATYNLGDIIRASLPTVDFSQLNPAEDASLRDYQIENKRKIYEEWQKHRSVMLQMPTGTGKTRLFVSIVKDLHNWGKNNKHAVKVLILAHRKELIEQISYNVGYVYRLAHGLIMSQNKENKQYPVQVGSVPTLNKRLNEWEDKYFDVIIVDEAHHVKASSYKKILNQYPAAKILGVTATPYRLNGSGFKPEFDTLIVSPSIAEFIKKGYLCEYDYYSIKSESRLQRKIDEMKIDSDGDYMEEDMINVMDKDSIRARIVETYLKFAKGLKGIVYTVNRSHNIHICEKFKKAGINAAAIDGTTPKEVRTDLVYKFRNGHIDILCNVNIFSEGFDCPDVEFIQLARPTKSLSLFLQQVGRGFRPAPGKKKLIILDNVGLYNKFGFPSAKRYWRHHFEGKNIPEIESNHYGILEETRSVFDIEEGEEPVELLHSSMNEIVNEEEITNAIHNYKKEYHQYLEELGLKQSTISQYCTLIETHIDNLVREYINAKHSSLYNISNSVEVERIFEILKDNAFFKNFNKKEHHAPSATLKKYIQFLKNKQNQFIKGIDNQEKVIETQDNIFNETRFSELKTIINLCQRNNLPLPDEIETEYNKYIKSKYEQNILDAIENELQEMSLRNGLCLKYESNHGIIELSYNNPDLNNNNIELNEVEQILNLMNKNHFTIPAEIICRKMNLLDKIYKKNELVNFKKWFSSYIENIQKTLSEDNCSITNVTIIPKSKIKISYPGSVVESNDKKPFKIIYSNNYEGNAKKTCLVVTLDDGSLIKEETAKDTFIKALKYIGLEKIQHLNFQMFGKSFLHNIPNKKYRSAEVEVLPGLYINTTITNENKVNIINSIAQEFGLNIKANLINAPKSD